MSADVHESIALTLPSILGIWAWQSEPTETVKGAGMTVIVGGVVSTTVNRTGQVEAFPDRSLTVMVTVCCPSPNSVPGAISCVITSDSAGVQLSEATTWGTKFGTAAWHVESAETVTGGGQDPVGALVSTTVTVRLAVSDAPQGSVTFSVTTVFPMGKDGLNVTVVPRTEPLALHS